MDDTRDDTDALAPGRELSMVRDAMSQYEEYSGDVEAINAYNKTPPIPKPEPAPTPKPAATPNPSAKPVLPPAADAKQAAKPAPADKKTTAKTTKPVVPKQ